MASLLSMTQNAMGLDSKLISLLAGDLRTEPFKRPDITLAAGIDEFLVSNHHKPTLVSLFRSRLSKLDQNLIRNSSIIHFHWLEGLMTPSQIRDLLSQGRKIVWTLHDMAPFTGGCHHAHDCRGFQESCQNCPQVRQQFRASIEQNLKSKILQQPNSDLVLVAPTPWLAKLARESAVFGKQKIVHIENPIRGEFFELAQKLGRSKIHKKAIGQPVVLTAVASDLANPAKGIRELLLAFKAARVGEATKLQLVGKRGEPFHDPGGGVHWLGAKSASELATIASTTDLLISSSEAESAGLTVREFGALGVPTLALASGGITDLIENEKSGWLVNDFRELTLKLQQFLSFGEFPFEIGRHALALAENNRPETVAEHYSKVYLDLSPTT